MPQLYIIKIAPQYFCVDNDGGNQGVGYGMMIVIDLMLHLGLMTDFKPNIIEWNDTVVTINYMGRRNRQTNISKCDMKQVVLQTSESDSIKEAFKIVLRPLTTLMRYIALKRLLQI